MEDKPSYCKYYSPDWQECSHKRNAEGYCQMLYCPLSSKHYILHKMAEDKYFAGVPDDGVKE